MIKDVWGELKQHVAHLDLLGFKCNNDYVVSTDNVTLDFSAQRFNQSVLTSLLDLARVSRLKEWIEALMSGYPVNDTDQKPVLHTALRVRNATPIFVNGQDVVQGILETREMMRVVSDLIRNGEWLGYSGKPITDVVGIGIGGSQLGSQFCIDALRELVIDKLNFHFLSDMDNIDFQRTVLPLNQETTLFIVASKSFTTQETLENTKRAIDWMTATTCFNIEPHFIAITSCPHKATEFGIKHVFQISDWVVGRYSMGSAIYLIACIAIGFENFCDLLDGANSMDLHFRNTDFAANLPVLLALLGIWNNNFLNIHQLLLLTYAKPLQFFVPFVQQMDIESNGKSVSRNGDFVDLATGPIVWGGLGSQAQHSYYQLLCQGTHRIAVDLISIKRAQTDPIHQLCLAHKQILSQGNQATKYTRGWIAGNMPINHIYLKDCSPQSIGALIALYEHKIFVQGIIWNINSFDQLAVESSKNFMRDYAAKMQTQELKSCAFSE